MRKKDLDTGMVVETATTKYIVYITPMGDYLANGNAYMRLEEYTEDLIFKGDGIFSIKKVYSPVDGFSLQTNLWGYNFDRWFVLRWDRNSEETIKIGNHTYNKQEFEKATRDLKPIK